MTEKEILDIIKSGENSFVEFKLNFNIDVIISLCAFANAKGGKVIIGISDIGEVRGISIHKESFQTWLNEIKSKTIPSIIPDIEVVDINNKKILIISIPEFPIKPVSMQGRYFQRKNNSNHQLSLNEISDLYIQSMQISWDSYTYPNSTINDINLKKVAVFINNVNKIGRFHIEEIEIKALEKLGLIKENKPTNAGMILFSKENLRYNVHIGKFKTPDKIIADKMINGNLFDVLEESLQVIIGHLKFAFEITGKTTQRTEIPEYPLNAIRELLVNSLVHRDYKSSIDIQIKIFDQSISFFNPSGLYGNLKIEDLKTDNYRASTRNKLIAEALYLTSDIEKYGSGFIRIRKAIAEYPTMKFEYKEIPNGFLAELNYSKQKLSLDNVVDNVVDNEQKIIDLLKLNNKLSAKQLSEKLNITDRSVQRYLKTLREKGTIKRIGSDKGGYWKII